MDIFLDKNSLKFLKRICRAKELQYESALKIFKSENLSREAMNAVEVKELIVIGYKGYGTSDEAIFVNPTEKGRAYLDNLRNEKRKFWLGIIIPSAIALAALIKSFFF